MSASNPSANSPDSAQQSIESAERSAHMSGERITDAQLAEAKQYHWQSFRCDLMDRAIDLIYLTIAALFLARPLDAYLSGQLGIQSRELRLIAMYVILTLIHVAVSFPLSYYSGHILEHRYGLSRQTFRRWLGRYAKRHTLTILFGSLLILGLYSIIWRFGGTWWFVAAGGYFVLSIILGQLTPIIILPLFYKIERFDDASLKDRLAQLSDGTGLSIEGVYRMKMSDETAKANAMLAGLGRTRRVILGDTLLDQFSPDEIGIVFAHEVGHHVHRHVPKLIVSGLLYTLLGFALCNVALRWWAESDNVSHSLGDLPVWTLPFLTLVLTLFGMVVEPIQNMISRHFERQSDTYALDRTRNPTAYRSAFTKLARLNKADPDPHRWEVFLFHSHPPIAERLKLADVWRGISQT